jgi:hypothetical protein
VIVGFFLLSLTISTNSPVHPDFSFVIMMALGLLLVLYSRKPISVAKKGNALLSNVHEKSVN